MKKSQLIAHQVVKCFYDCDMFNGLFFEVRCIKSGQDEMGERGY